MAKKGGLGLGLGLDALIGGSSTDKEEVSALGAIVNNTPVEISKSETATASNAANIPAGVEVDEDGGLWINLNLLYPNPNQPRKEFKQAELDELAESIKELGVFTPILVEKTDTEKFCIISGERRYRAALIAGVEKVPVQIRRYDLVKKLEVMLVENIQRADLNPIDEANAYYQLMQTGDLTQEEVAKRVGKGRSTVANTMRLLGLPEDMQKSLIEGQISPGHARALLAVTNMADQRILFGKIIGSDLSVRKAEEMAKDLNGGSRAAGKKLSKTLVKEDKDPDVAEIEQKFIEVFGTKVILKGSIDKGSIIIDYFSKEDLDRLYNVIVKQS